MKQLGVGVIGCGEIAFTYHLPALARCNNMQVLGVISKSPESAGRAANEYGARPYARMQDLLAAENLRAVLILTPNYLRVEHVAMCAQAKKAMLVQKPLARTEQECMQVIEYANRAGVVLVPSFMHRYLPEVLKAREMLRQGLLGDIHTVRIRNATPGSGWASWFYQRELVGGGAAMDVGVHGIDLVRWLVGEIRSVSAQIARKIPERLIRGRRVIPDNEDTAVALYRLDNDALCVHEITWCEFKGYGRFEMEIYGKDGSLQIRGGRAPLAVASRHLNPPDEWLVPDLPRPFLGVTQHEDFARAVMDGPSEITAHTRDGLAAVRIVEKLYEAAATGKTLEVEPL